VADQKRQDTEVGIVQQLAAAEFELDVSTAKRFPRDLTLAKRKIQECALTDPETAETMFYRLPARKNRDGSPSKPIEGPSIRLAEIVLMSWPNFRAAARVLDSGDAPGAKYVIVEAACKDLESNVSLSQQVRRRITTHDGRKYSDDMINVTVNAAVAIAYRNTVLRVVPSSVWRPVYEKALAMARQASKGGKAAGAGKAPQVSLEDRWKIAVVRFSDEFGVTDADLLRKIGRKAPAEVTEEDLVTLRGLYNAIRSEEVTMEEAFGEEEPAERPGVKNQKGNLDLDGGTKGEEGRPFDGSDSPPEPGAAG
jgi:hypothetical protein